MKINKNNYYTSTYAKFVECATPRRKPDYISSSGSRYWYTKNGVIRKSDHWSLYYCSDPNKTCFTASVYLHAVSIASCIWTLQLKKDKITVKEDYGDNGKILTGFCKYKNFRHVNDK